nr:hypothetical protein [Mesorhizobium sp.]
MSYARSVPVVLQLFVAFYGLPLLVILFGAEDFISATIAAVVGLSLYHGGYLSEVMRPAYLAVGRSADCFSCEFQLNSRCAGTNGDVRYSHFSVFPTETAPRGRLA